MIRAISRAERIFLRVSSGWPQHHKWFLAAAVLSLSLPAVAQVGNSFLRASPPQSPFAGQPGSDAKYVAGEVLVRFRRGAARAAMNSLHAKVGATVIRASRVVEGLQDRKSTRLNSSHGYISYAVFCLKKKKKHIMC